MKVLFIALWITVSSLVYAAPELKGNPEDLRGFLHPHKRLVSITETAEQTAYSDVAVVHLVVTTEEDTLAEALQKNSQLREMINTTLMQQGINRETINSSKFSSTPQYGWFGEKPDSYKVVNRMVVRIRSEAHLQLQAKVADKYDEVVLSKTVFEHSEKDQYQQTTKQQALDKVLAKKRYYEQALGIALKAIAFHDQPLPLIPTDGASMREDVLVSAVKREAAGLSKLRSTSPAVLTQADSFDEVKYRAQITVEFEVQ